MGPPLCQVPFSRTVAQRHLFPGADLRLAGPFQLARRVLSGLVGGFPVWAVRLVGSLLGSLAGNYQGEEKDGFVQLFSPTGPLLYKKSRRLSHPFPSVGTLDPLFIFNTPAECGQCFHCPRSW